MGRRSPNNARYRKDAQVGSTRRSASSAKPKREAGKVAAGAGTSSKPSKPVYADPPEVKKWRIAWAILLGVALIPVAYVLGPQALTWLGAGPGWPVNPLFAQWGLYFEMAALGGALYIDFAVIRKIQQAAREAQADKPAKKSEREGV